MRRFSFALWTPALALCWLAACGTTETPDGAVADTGGSIFGVDTGGALADSGEAPLDSGAAATDSGTVSGDSSAVDDVADACASDDPTCDGVDDDCDGQTDEDAAGGDCDDNNPCTTDACDPATKQCTHVAQAGPCDDGDACTTGDTCAGTTCTGQATDCNDNNDCTQDQCHPVTGKCGYAVSDGKACDDGDACTSGDACKGSSCLAGTPKLCPPGAPCTVGLCDQSSGACSVGPAPEGSACEDGNPCTVQDSCKAGVCSAGPAKSCGIDNPCIGGSCDPQSGKCVTSPAGDGTPCNDANKCTQSDVCKAGKCGGALVVCDDSNPCTDDSCDLAVGCTSTDNSAACDDGKPCTTKDACAGGACGGGQLKDCDDSNPCTVDSCDPSTGACLHAGDGVKGKVCSDGDKCTLTDTCDGQGKCAPGTAKSCDDDKPCTVDKCDPNTGTCAHPQAPAGAGCSDGSFCTIGDTCDAKGGCAPGKAITCSDNNPCTGDGCDAKTGKCTFQPFPNGAGCDDGDLCTKGDSCQKGVCVPGKGSGCDDGNSCTSESCDPKTGKCAVKNLTTPCTDNDACTLSEACNGGSCKAAAAGTTSTIFGTGTASFLNGAAAQARVYYPQGLDTAKDGRVFLADRNNHRIRLYKPDAKGGQVSTFAGSGSNGSTEGAAASARFYYPADVAWHEGSKTLYVADRSNHRIRKIVGGQVSTLAGSVGGKVDGKGSSARFNAPEGLDVSIAGVVFVADTYNHCIRRVAADGTVTTLSGTGSAGYTNGAGNVARFYYPRGVSLRPDGALLVADSSNHRVRLVTSAGVASLYAGSGSTGMVNGNLTSARFYNPYDVAVGPGGEVFVADASNRRVRKIAGGQVSTYSGSGSSGYLDGAPNVARFASPYGLAVDVLGQVWVADYSNHRVRRLSRPKAACDDQDACTSDKCDPKSGCAFTALKSGSSCSDGSACTVSDVCTTGGQCVGKAKVCSDSNPCTLDGCNTATGQCTFTKSSAACDDGNACTLGETCATGSCKPAPTGTVTTAFGTGSSGFTDGAATTARVYYPRGLDTATDGRVFLADRSNHRVRVFQPSAKGGSLSTYAGSGSASFLDGAVKTARFYEPTDVAWHGGSKTLYVADRRNHRIRKIAGGKVTTLAGSSSTGLVDGKGSAARFYYPEGITVSVSGVVYVSDTYNHAIRRVLADGTVTTLAGSKSNGYLNGKGAAARFYYPRGLTISGGGLVVADSYNHRLRKVGFDGTVSLLAGSGSAGITNGALTTARFYYPHDVASGPGGVLVVADKNNHRIRRVSGGQVTVLAGSGSASYLDGAATSARFYYPQGIAVDVYGQTWVGDYQNHRVRKVGVPNAACDDQNACTVDSCNAKTGCAFKPKTTGASCSDGDACTLNDACSAAGQCTGKAKVCTDGQPCTHDACDPLSGKCSFPPNTGACDDGDACTTGEQCGGGTCSVPDSISTWVGNGSGGYTNGKGAATRVYYPRGLDRSNASGDIYLADRNNHRIRRVTPDGTINFFAGIGSAGNTNGAVATARFYYPSDVAVSGDGSTVYVADRYNHRIRKIAGGQVSTLAGSTNGFTNATGTTARFYYPEGVAVDPTNGSVVVADSYNNRIRRVSPTGVTTTIAGSGSSSYKEGKGTTANFYRPHGVDVGPNGVVYVADSYNHRVRRILTDGTTQLIAGSSAAFADGVGANARFVYPSDVSVRGDGQLLIADRGNHRVRLVNPANGAVSTLAGSSGGFLNGAATSARFNNPYAVQALPSANGGWPMVVSDYSNHRLRKSGPGGAKSCDDGNVCTVDSCDSKTGCSNKPVVNCCNPVKTNLQFTQESEASGWTFRKCSASTNYYTPVNCGSPYTANSATKGWQVWGSSPTHKSKSGALFYGQRAGPNFNFSASAGTALSPKMKVPAGTATLKFSIYCGTESGNKYDKSYVFLYVNGAKVNIKSAASPTYGSAWYLGQSGTTANTWYTVSVNVSAYSGKDLQVMYYFNSGDSVANTGKGVYVDDVQLIGTCPK